MEKSSDGVGLGSGVSCYKPSLFDRLYEGASISRNCR